MRVELQRAIEVRAGIDRAVAVVRSLAAPENDVAVIIARLEFHPAIESVHGAARKEVADLARADHHLDAHRVAAAHAGLHSPQRRDERGNRQAAHPGARQSRGGFFTHRKGAGKLRRFRPPARGPTFFRAFRGLLRQGEDIDAHGAFQKILDGGHLLLVAVGGWHRGVGGGKAMRVDEAVDVAEILRRHHAACGSPRTVAAWADSRTSARPGRKRRWPASCRNR